MVIWKFPVMPITETTIDAPDGTKFLSVQSEHNVIMLYAIVRPELGMRMYRFRVYMTGEPIPDADAAKLTYIGTCMTFGGDLVWHVFQVTR